MTAVGPHSLLVLDNAYVPLADYHWDSIPLLRHGNVAVLHSMTKDHALAGVRLGYLVASPDVIAAVRELQPAWSVNSVAQAAGLAALADEDHVATGRKVVQEAKAYLRRELCALGIPVNPSVTNFLLAQVGDAAKVRNALLQRRIAVRDCTSFGLPQYIRVAARRPEECATLVKALKEVMTG